MLHRKNKAIPFFLKLNCFALLVPDKVTFYRRWAEKGLSATKVKSFDLFPKAEHKIGFTDQKLQQEVSQLLQKWQDSGRVAQLQKQSRQFNPSLN